MLVIQDLSLDYAGVVALHGVDLHVGSGQLVAVLGANGAGKSSLMAAVSGLHRPISGTIEFLGSSIHHCAADVIARRGISLVPEGRRLFSHLTVRENLSLGCYYERQEDEVTRRLESVVDLFPFVGSRLNQRAGTLSGGEQQMVALGRALMNKPKMLMLDEPSLGVAPKITQEIFAVLRSLRDQGMTIVLVEQDVNAALGMCDRAFILQTGRVVLSGAGKELMDHDDVRRAYLGM